MAFLLKQMERFVVESLKAREHAAEFNASTTELRSAQLGITTGKMPWIRMQSNAHFTSGPKGASSWPQSWILQSRNISTTKRVTDLYETTYNRPLPGIEGLNSTIKGTLGLVREVKVDFICHTLYQLEVMQALYMTPGVGALIEWGWSSDQLSLGGINLYGKSLESGPPSDDIWLARMIAKEVKACHGNYDALFGLVCDFSIDMQDDGTFKCSTTIMGPSAMTNDFLTKTPGNDANEAFIRYMDETIEKSLAFNSKGVGFGGAARTKGTAAPVTNGRRRSHLGMCKFSSMEQKVVDPTTDITTPPNQNTQLTPEQEKRQQEDQTFADNAKNLYLSWEQVEAFINGYFGSKLNNGVVIDSVEPQEGVKDPEPVCLVGKLNKLQYTTTDTKEPYDVWRSFSPTTMIIPGYPKSNWQTADGKPETVADASVFDFGNYGNLMGVFVNYGVIKDAFRNNDTLRGSLTTILNQLNEAAGGVWDLTLSLNGRNYTTLAVVDLNCAGATAPSPSQVVSTYMFPSHTKSSNVRAVSAAMSIPTALKTTVAIGTNMRADAPINGVDNSKTGIIRSFSNGVVDRWRYKNADTETAEQKKLYEERKKREEEARNSGVKRKYFETLSGEEKDALISYMLGNRSISDMGQSMLVPLEVTVTIDGLAGFVWGDAFTIRNLPKRYHDRAVFQTFNIAHTVDNTKWETTISGKMRILPTQTIGGYTGVTDAGDAKQSTTTG
jgi:hypothetical protein